MMIAQYRKKHSMSTPFMVGMNHVTTRLENNYERPLRRAEGTFALDDLVFTYKGMLENVRGKKFEEIFSGAIPAKKATDIDFDPEKIALARDRRVANMRQFVALRKGQRMESTSHRIKDMMTSIRRTKSTSSLPHFTQTSLERINNSSGILSNFDIFLASEKDDEMIFKEPAVFNIKHPTIRNEIFTNSTKLDEYISNMRKKSQKKKEERRVVHLNKAKENQPHHTLTVSAKLLEGLGGIGRNELEGGEEWSDEDDEDDEDDPANGTSFNKADKLLKKYVRKITFSSIRHYDEDTLSYDDVVRQIPGEVVEKHQPAQMTKTVSKSDSAHSMFRSMGMSRDNNERSRRGPLKRDKSLTKQGFRLPQNVLFSKSKRQGSWSRDSLRSTLFRKKRNESTNSNDDPPPPPDLNQKKAMGQLMVDSLTGKLTRQVSIYNDDVDQSSKCSFELMFQYATVLFLLMNNLIMILSFVQCSNTFSLSGDQS